MRHGKPRARQLQCQSYCVAVGKSSKLGSNCSRNRMRVKPRRPWHPAAMDQGMADGDGSRGTVDCIVQSIENGVAAFKQARRKEAAFAHLTFLGDCMEGFVSQRVKNAWRTELTLTEQLRLTRRLMLHAIDSFATSPH